MNEFLPRTEAALSATGATERIRGVRAASPATPDRSRVDAAAAAKMAEPVTRPAAPTTAAGAIPHDEAIARARADFAQVRAQVASVMADLANQQPPRMSAVVDGEARLVALLPQPRVVQPLPPASQEMMQFVAQVTGTIARQAAQTRAAMSGVSAAMVDVATD